MDTDRDKVDSLMEELFNELCAALKPFADEGEKWIETPDRHDDLKLLVAEDWHLVSHVCREATFTIGDLKRAYKLLKDME